ncbi:SDR family NAD(P)-dependent oxidoreductase [Leucobacter allii]|uniref:SDR family NAD(P)-dependent oxidoreductase n=1 Tax=Leucobacter allii TaxID=2932247 RepID=A0ABY4FMM6_9MICO|nr:SDR family NAD(P)-dependent oxidoreductase [Leucobacter allii]UOQ57528.1 SDR family NAD(P)-dependent oxidoreductase [Leucobacter allii]
MNAELDFASANAVVTGAGSGIGRSIALELARLGTQVLVADINGEAAAAVAAEITAAGGTAISRGVDVTDLASVEALADDAFGEFGRVDILCNNAGVTWRPFRAVWNAKISDWRWMMEVNFFGVLNGVQTFLPRMREQSGRKHIVNTSSLAVHSTNPGHAPYTASKHAVDGLSDVLREELVDHRDDFGVTVLYPGLITTNIGETSKAVRQQETGDDLSDAIAYEQVRTFDFPHNAPKSPENVGKQVVEAIRQNDPYCITHPAPTDQIEERGRLLARGYRGH